MPSPAFRREHPRAREERRLMAHMLPMTAGQVGDPVAVLIQVVPDDRLVHGPTPGNASITSHSVFAGEYKLSLLKRTLRTFSSRHKAPMLFSIFIEATDVNDFSVEVPEL